MDLLALAFGILFEGSLVVAGVLLLATYVAFARMNKDVRRARMFIMSDRVRRFLGAFTFGFLLIAAASVLTIAGMPGASAVFLVVIFLFLAAIIYGSLELYLIVRPPRSRLLHPRRSAASRPVAGPMSASPPPEAEEGGSHASR